MRQGFLPRCGMDAKGGSQSRGRWRTARRGKRAIWPACAFSSSSFLTKVVSFVAEELVPYLIALVSSCALMPLSALIGTLCTYMCSWSVAAECGLVSS